jgi:hypothetical protein
LQPAVGASSSVPGCVHAAWPLALSWHRASRRLSDSHHCEEWANHAARRRGQRQRQDRCGNAGPGCAREFLETETCKRIVQQAASPFRRALLTYRGDLFRPDDIPFRPPPFQPGKVRIVRGPARRPVDCSMEGKLTGRPSNSARNWSARSPDSTMSTNIRQSGARQVGDRERKVGRPYRSTCSIRVSTRAFVRIWRIVRKRKLLKSFVFNNRRWCESHPLRHNKPSGPNYRNRSFVAAVGNNGASGSSPFNALRAASDTFCTISSEYCVL